MKKTQAEILLGKFKKLVTALKTQEEPNPQWLNNVIAVLERHSLLDTMTQICDAWHSEFDSASHGNLGDQMIKANDLWKTAKVHPMFI